MTDKSKKFCFQPSLVKELGLRSGYAARRREIGWLDQQISNSRRGGAIDAQYRAIRLLVFRWFRAGLVGWPLQPALNSQRSLRVFSTTMAQTPRTATLACVRYPRFRLVLSCLYVFLVERWRPHNAFRLAKLDGYYFRVSARRAFKSPPVLSNGVGWFNLRKKHRQSAFRTSPLSNRR